MTDVAVDSTSAPVEHRAAGESANSRSRRAVAAESTLLLLSPLLVGWPLRAQLWATTSWLDPYLQTAVIQHGRDLLDRYGTDNRRFARAGVAVPGRLFNLIFGDLGGYLAFRYFLALVAVLPAYLLFRRLYGRGAGAVAVVSVLANPVVLLAWGTDYGDCAAVGYLVAGTCCLVMPTSSPRRRIGWVAAAGVALSLALHSLFVALPLVGGLVLAHAVLTARRGWRQALSDLGTLVVTLAVTTGALVLMSIVLYGHGDILSPTWTAYQRLRMPDQVRQWHSPGAGWVLDDPYLLVPPTVVACWAVARLRRGAALAVAERTVVLAALLQSAAYCYLQFLNTEQTLEFYLYLSMLWPAVVLVSAFAVVAVTQRLLGAARTAWVPATLVLLAPLALHPLREQLVLRAPWLGLLLAATLAAAAAAAGLTRARGHPTGALVLGTVLVAGWYVLLTGTDTSAPWRPGQVHYPAPHYATVIATPYGRERDEYAAASQLHHVVPAPEHPGTPLLLWWTRKPFSSAVNIAAAQYANPNSLQGSLPRATPADLRQIRQRKPDYVVLLSPTGRELDAALTTLACIGVEPTLTRTAELHHGSVRLVAQVVRVRVAAATGHRGGAAGTDPGSC